MISNRQIRRIFTLYAKLLDLHEKQAALAVMLPKAAFYVRRIRQNIITLDKKSVIKLFHAPIAKIILELQQTGTIEALDELIQLTPAGLFEMMKIKGLGGKKLLLLWRRAKIDTVDGLLKACKQKKLTALPGFGPKIQENIITAIESGNLKKTHFHYAQLSPIAEGLIHHLQRATKSSLISLAGDIRRKTLTVSTIEVVAAVASKKIIPLLKGQLIVKTSTLKMTSGITLDELPATIYHCSRNNFHQLLFEKTGNENHVKKVKEKIKQQKIFKSEADIYHAAKLPYVVPEMREDMAEWKFKKSPSDLITMEGIKGVVHNHTTYSDGVDKLENFVRACIEKGYEYTVISDHSKNAFYAGGLKEAKVIQQWEQIDQMNKIVKPFHIFKSIECDIKVSGELDYDKNFLKKFDLLIVSIHQLLKMDENTATKRLIKAIEHPLTTILGHMTGRLLLIRPGYPINHKKVIDACAANKVVIELNANPYRLDIDWTHIPYALSKNVMISINPDAHSIKEIDNIRWGVAAARKAGLTKAMTWNAMNLAEVLDWLRKKQNYL
jgi:DNA polymerase (family 10)